MLSSVPLTQPSPADHRIPVVIHTADPLSGAGVTHHLGPHPAIELVDSAADHPPSDTSRVVAVFVADTLDDTTLMRLRRLMRRDGARTVLVVHRLRESDLLEIIASGVSVVLWRHEVSSARLFEAVTAASRGEGDMPAELLGRLMTQIGSLARTIPGGTAALTGGLTPREVEVVRLVAEGLDTKEIAAALNYSERTIKNNLHALTTRLHLRNRAHAVAHAVREGYI
ncbi:MULTISPECIES: helix-turn-helix transcriptional regulator [unclassified Streptomyces]|uniref:helix-turn-helix transcriptional regulator n=1 Tax=unclassified Streptomyces TaxID=2593676 RepID=UPI0007488860|nr:MULTISPECIES: response regulator transcription factor [unclassified Streptomyces]KUL52233.1 LuxR family transcriptional regulator [Streptomyces sp. NRRL S-1521]THC41562.1 response regulator transcription factor [Streptomyces sp. A1499]